MTTEIPVVWLFSAIALTAIVIVIAGLVVLRQNRIAGRAHQAVDSPMVAGSARPATTSGGRSVLEHHTAVLRMGDPLAAHAALEHLAVLARRDQPTSAAVTAAWCAHLRQHSRVGDERVARAVQQRLSEHLTRQAAETERLPLDLGGAVLRDLDLDGTCLAAVNLSRAWLGGTTRLSLTCSGNLDASDAHFDGDLLAPRATVGQRLSLQRAIVEGALDLSGGLVVHRELDLSGTAVVGRTFLRGLVAGTLRLHGPEGTALFGGRVDLSDAVASPVQVNGDEFAGGLTISPAPGATRRFAGYEPGLVAALRDALESPLRV